MAKSETTETAPEAKAEDLAPTPPAQAEPALGGSPGATSVPGGGEARTIVTLASEPQDCDTSLAEVPDGIKVGQFIGVDPGSVGAPSSHKRMPIDPD